MTINEAYVCPVCGKAGNIVGVQTLMEDVRFDAIQCECGATWRAYYKTSQIAIEMTNVPYTEEPKVDEKIVDVPAASSKKNKTEDK